MRMSPLKELLNDIILSDLKKYVRMLNLSSSATRKAELVDAIEGELSGNNLLRVFESLNDLEQKAVAEAIYAEDLCFDKDKLMAKYGSAPPFYKTNKNVPYARREEMQRVKLFFYMKRYTSGKVMIPQDVAHQLRQFVKRPAVLHVKTLDKPVEEKGLVVVDTEYEAVYSVTALLRLAEQGKLKISEKTGVVTKAVSATVLKQLNISDYYTDEIAFPTGRYDQAIGNVKPIGWLRMLEVAGLFKMVGTQSKLTASGIKMLNKPAHEVILHIWKKWLANSKYDEFNRVEEIKGQSRKGHMTAKPPRRNAIVKGLSDCPVGQWIDMQVFSKYMLGVGYDFRISQDESKLYLCDPQYGHLGYDDYGGWHTVEYRYILAFMFEYAATLGLIDIAHIEPDHALHDFRHQWGAEDLSWLSRYDGLRAFRITGLGAYCLGLTDVFHTKDNTEGLSLSVSPNLTIEVISGQLQPQHKLLLETWAKQETKSVWRLDPLRARDAIERGQDKQTLLEFIGSSDDQFLPDTVIGFLRTSELDAQALKRVAKMVLFTCRDCKTCDLISKHKDTAKYCMKCSETQLVVFSDKLDKFRKSIHAMGLGIV